MDKRIESEKWFLFGAALRGFLMQGDKENMRLMVKSLWNQMDGYQTEFTIREITPPESGMNFYDTVLTTEEISEMTDGIEIKGFDVWSDDFKWKMVMSALVYYKGRMTISSASFPGDVMSMYGRHLEDWQKKDILNVLKPYYERAGTFGDETIDSPIWEAFMKYCDPECHQNVRYFDNIGEIREEICFESRGKLIPVSCYEKYVHGENFRLPLEITYSGEKKYGSANYLNIRQMEYLRNCGADLSKCEKGWFKDGDGYKIGVIGNRTEECHIPSYSYKELDEAIESFDLSVFTGYYNDFIRGQIAEKERPEDFSLEIADENGFKKAFFRKKDGKYPEWLSLGSGASSAGFGHDEKSAMCELLHEMYVGKRYIERYRKGFEAWRR